MPASELGWTSSGHSDVFQVFGTKRKAGPEDSEEMHSCSKHQIDQTAKRQCNWTPPQVPAHPMQHQPLSSQMDLFHNNNNNNTIPHSSLVNGMELNHNSPSMPDRHQIQELQQISSPALSQVMSQQPPRVPSPWPSHQPYHPSQSQNDHIMDLNDEVLNPAASLAAATLEADTATVDMESDFVPDSNQYAPPTSQPRAKDSDFCNSFCGVGETSPRSGRVRCYCKPSWEGMMDMRPYISDVY